MSAKAQWIRVMSRNSPAHNAILLATTNEDKTFAIQKYPKQIKKAILQDNNKLFVNFINKWATDEQNQNAYGNVSDKLPLDLWPFLTLENFILNFHNNELEENNRTNPGYDTYGYIKNDSLITKIAKDYAKYNKVKSFKQISDIYSKNGLLDVGDFEPMLLCAEKAVRLADALGIKKVTWVNKIQDWGTAYYEVDNYANDDSIPKKYRKRIIQNFSRLFRNWKWQDETSGRSQFAMN
jgi:hypothetical protein